jgi:hypothetical protein
MSNQYHFITRWRVRATAAEIFSVIGDPTGYPRWWPSVYLEVTELAPAGSNGVGQRLRYCTKGWLPYTLRWESCCTEADPFQRIEIRATGDFDGRGIWTFQADGGFVNVTFDWKLSADKPLLRYLSFMLKPVFAANHVWAMKRGRESLELELARRHAATDQERSRIPSPPRPNKTSGLWLSVGALAVTVCALALWRALR